MFDHLPFGEAFSTFLSEWKRASEGQIDALKTSDWRSFQAALDAKSSLMEAWGGYVRKQTGDVSLRTTQQESLIREILDLDAQVETAISQVRDTAKAELRRHDKESRALRAYRRRPQPLHPFYIDKKF